MDLTKLLFFFALILSLISVFFIAFFYRKRLSEVSTKFFFFLVFFTFGGSMVWVDTFVDDVFMNNAKDISTFRIIQGVLLLLSFIVGFSFRKRNNLGDKSI